jgi:hypothetical protein
MEAAKSLADTNTLREMRLLRCEEGNQMGTAWADIVNRKWFRAGWAANVDDLTGLFFEIDEDPVPIAQNRADNQKPFTGFVFQFQSKTRMPLESGRLRKNHMSIRTIAFSDHFTIV